MIRITGHISPLRSAPAAVRAVTGADRRSARLLGLLEAAAAAGRVCPTNAELARLLGLASTSGPAMQLQLLEAEGLVTVRRGHWWRVVTIAASGRATARPEGAE